MTFNQVTKQIEKIEAKVAKLHKELLKTNSTKIEMEWMKQKEILIHLEKIKWLLS